MPAPGVQDFRLIAPLTSQRIERAKALLAERKRSVTEIGFDVGFSETSSFTSAFRKVTGETPTDYRRSLA
jgi:AraC family transcriptional regulator